MRYQRKPTADKEQSTPAPKDPYPQRCHWAKNTPHRCQMLGTMGAGREAHHPGGETGTWYCSLHNWEAQGQRQIELKSYDALQAWMARMAREYPQCQWNDDPQIIWLRLHGNATEPATYEPCRPEAGDGEIPTLEELDHVFAAFERTHGKTAFGAELLSYREWYKHRKPGDLYTPASRVPQPDERRVTQERKRELLEAAREKGVLP